MNYLATLLLWLGSGGGHTTRSAHATHGTPKVSDCFKVHDLLKMDEEHYWANWTNGCPYTIESVYVMVRFTDHNGAQVNDGVWAMYNVRPGAHRVNRFTAPRTPEFHRVSVKRITTDSAEALTPTPVPTAAADTSKPAGFVGDPGPSKVERKVE